MHRDVGPRYKGYEVLLDDKETDYNGSAIPPGEVHSHYGHRGDAVIRYP